MTDEGVTFLLPDPERRLDEVRLHQELRRPRTGPAFPHPSDSGPWTLTFPRLGVDRMEYLFELRSGDGSNVVCDPGNPLRAPGPFGDRSVVEYPGYRPPGWALSPGRLEGTVSPAPVHSRILRADVDVQLWASPDVGDREVPLLVVHDGPEYARFSSLLHMLEAAVAAGSLPPMRAALVPPVRRDHDYSASATYARALVHEVLPHLARAAPTPHGRRMRAGMGASLGAVAMLHAHSSHPDAFGGLMLQSGSFFRPHLDGHEAGFFGFRRICRFTGSVAGGRRKPHPIPIAMTCGRAEENLANNEAMRDALSGQGYEVGWHTTADAHNWVSWRDALEPALVELLQGMWR